VPIPDFFFFPNEIKPETATRSHKSDFCRLYNSTSLEKKEIPVGPGYNFKKRKNKNKVTNQQTNKK